MKRRKRFDIHTAWKRKKNADWGDSEAYEFAQAGEQIRRKRRVNSLKATLLSVCVLGL